ncbi:MAG: DUF4836 family protein [Bacteroidia bacterium]|nr:DUF4836 family protein [Bacteroidia bacterium]
MKHLMNIKQVKQAGKSGFLWILCIVFSLFSCGKSVEHSKYIPKETALVICLNLKEITKKAQDWYKLLNHDIPLLNIQGTDQLGRQLLTAGIDFSSPAYFFSDVSRNSAESYYAIAFKLNDESKFDDFLRSLPNQELDINAFSGMRYTLLNNKTILGWANKVALLVAKPEKSTEKALKDRLIKLRDLPEDQSLKASNDQFRRLRISEYDVATWINVKAFDEEVKQFLKNFPLPVNVDLSNNFLTSVTQFHEGEVKMNVKLHNANESLENYQDVVKQGIDPALIRKVPVQSPIGVLGLGLNMKGIKDIFRLLGANLVERQTINLTGSSPNEIMDMLSGDVLAVLKDVRPGNAKEGGKYEYVIGVGIRQQVTLDKILEKFSQEGAIEKRGSVYYAPQVEVYLIEQQNTLLITPSDSIKNSLLRKSSGRDSLASNNDLSLLGAKSFFMLHTQLTEETRQKLPSDLFGDDKFAEGMVKFTQTPIESVTINTLPLANQISQTFVVLYFKEKKPNALQLLINMIQDDQSSRKIKS